MWFLCLCEIILMIGVEMKSRHTMVKTRWCLVWHGILWEFAGDCSRSCSSVPLSPSLWLFHSISDEAETAPHNCSRWKGSQALPWTWTFPSSVMANNDLSAMALITFSFFPSGFLLLKNKLNFGPAILSKQKLFCQWCWARSQSKHLKGFFFLSKSWKLFFLARECC